MDAVVMTLAPALVLGLIYQLLFMRLQNKCDRLRDELRITENANESHVRMIALLRDAAKESEETIRVLRRKLAKARNAVATPSQPVSQEMQPEAPEVVAQLPVAASRLAAYVREQAEMTGRTLTPYEAEQMAASMLVESGI